MGQSKLRKSRIIDKQDLPRWLEALGREARLIAPVRAARGEPVFSDLERPEDLVTDYVNTLIPPKQFVLPQLEPMFRFRSSPEGWSAEPIYDEEKRIIFGIRSCDVSAIRFLDRFFSSNFEDIYYLKRRANTSLISISCQEPGENCFCICAECGPFLNEGYDIQLTDLGDRYLAEIGSERGRELIELASELFAEAADEDIQKRREIEPIVETRFKTAKTCFHSGIRKVSAEAVPEKLWQELGDRCLGCGGCSYACPTCSCFGVADLMHEGAALRMRCWDSCALAGFTRMAGGHNPRKEKQDRRNSRFYHKLSYYYIKRLGKHGCVGCGRCIAVCMGAISMPAVVGFIRRDELPSMIEAETSRAGDVPSSKTSDESKESALVGTRSGE